MSEFQTKLHSVPSGGFLTDRDKDKKPILGSSDLDQASPLTASLQTDFLLPLIYPVVRDGKIKAKFLQKRLDKRARESGDYVKAFLKMFGN